MSSSAGRVTFSPYISRQECSSELRLLTFSSLDSTLALSFTILPALVLSSYSLGSDTRASSSASRASSLLVATAVRGEEGMENTSGGRMAAVMRQQALSYFAAQNGV